MKQNATGFTLVEMTITLAIIFILAITSVNIFSSYARKGRRVDAINTIMQISLAEERYRNSNTTYGTLAQVWSGVTASSEGYYSMSITNVGASSYTITATAQGNQASDSVNGVSCSALVLTYSNGTYTKSPSTCWPQ